MAVKWAKVIDQRKCIGCHACTVACKSEHQVPLGVTRTFVKQVETGTFPAVRRHFQVTRCNQCDNAPCVAACPTSAMYQRPDGIVDFNRQTCIGCKACIAACPYDAIYIDPESHSAEKCNFCSHRIDIGLQPACVVVCPTQAIIVGDMTDPKSEVSQLIATEKSQVRRPEKGTLPKLFYVHGDQATLDPMNATAQDGYAWAERQIPSYPLQVDPQVMGGPGQKKTKAGYPARSAAAAILTYQNETKPPWDWRVSGYTWTKSIAAGVFLVAALGAIFSDLGDGVAGWDPWIAVVSAIFVGFTGILLIADLSHPKRFYTILLRPQWRSWLARGAFIITGYALLLALFFLASVLDGDTIVDFLRWPGMLLAAATAIYTAFLLGQAKGRDLWQNPLLPAHFLAQATLAGAAALLLLALPFDLSDDELQWLRWVFGLSLGVHLFLGLSELFMPHVTEEAARAARNMTWGKLASLFWGGLALSLVALALTVVTSDLEPWLAIAALLALVGLLLYEHAYIQAGQSVPLS